MNKQEAIKIREAILSVSKHLPDHLAEAVPKLFPRPEKGKEYKKGDRLFNPETGKLVKLKNDIVASGKLPEKAIEGIKKNKK